MGESPLKAEFEYYLQNQEQLVREYNGKVIVIKDRKVIGSYKTRDEAIREASKEHELGTFLVQNVAPGPDAYSQSFHSRVIFTGAPA